MGRKANKFHNSVTTLWLKLSLLQVQATLHLSDMISDFQTVTLSVIFKRVRIVYTTLWVHSWSVSRQHLIFLSPIVHSSLPKNGKLNADIAWQRCFFTSARERTLKIAYFPKIYYPRNFRILSWCCTHLILSHILYAAVTVGRNIRNW
jgi:hypothetical protein